MVTRDDVEVSRKPRRVDFAAQVVSGGNHDDKYDGKEETLPSQVGIRANKGIAMHKRQSKSLGSGQEISMKDEHYVEGLSFDE